MATSTAGASAQATPLSGAFLWDTIRDRPRVRVGLCLFLPALTLAGFFLAPLVLMFLYSLFSLNEADQIVADLTFQNYWDFLSKPLYYRVLLNTLWIALKVTLLSLPLAYPLAYFMATASRRHRNLLLALVIVPFWASYLVRTFAWMIIFMNQGVLESITSLFAPLIQPVDLLYTSHAVTVGFVHVFLPFMILPMYVSIANLDPDFLEAASDLGAGRVRTFLRVTLPLTLPGIAAGSILVFIPTFGSFVTPKLLGGVRDMMIGNIIERQFGEAFNWPFGCAIGFLVAVVVVGLLTVFNRALGSEPIWKTQ